MCGRYVSVRSDADLVSEFEAVDATDGQSPEPDYNVAPTKPVRVVVNRQRRDDAGQPSGQPVRQLRVASWGLVPSWSKDQRTAGRMFNARAESLATSRAFRRAYSARRCLVPADGWYEWAPLEARAGKQAYYMTAPDGHALAFAGLYEFWGEPGRLLTTCTVVTVASAGVLERIHDRMPLVLSRDSWTRWLDPSVSDPADLLQPWDEVRGEHLELRPVASTVNDVRNNGASLIKQVTAPVEAQSLF
jgi:putative SOS response-associated peptidase YedK